MLEIGSEADKCVVTGDFTIKGRLILVDKKDGKEWEVSISDGKLIYDPAHLEDKRDFKIDKIIG